MEQFAKVVDVEGRYATIEVSRKAMCDGCHKTKCGSSCPMSGLFSSGSKKMTARAINKIGAGIGDEVEIETSDRAVLTIAVLVFLLPIFLGGISYFLLNALTHNYYIAVITALVGFAIPFPFLIIFDKQLRGKEPQFSVKRIISSSRD